MITRRVETPISKMPSVKAYIGSPLIKLKGINPVVHTTDAAHNRGQVLDFSRAARKRMTDRLASVNRQKVVGLPLFVTLTYPAQFPTDPKLIKKHLDTFCKRMTRKYPTISIVWKLEYQKRGAAHYHLLVFNVPYIPAAWVAQAWYAVVASGDPKHLEAGTEVKRVRSWRGVAWYTAKYMTKGADRVPDWHIGRFWGVVNPDGLPVDELEIVLGWRDWWAIRRVLRKLAEKRGKRYGGAGSVPRPDGLFQMRRPAWGRVDGGPPREPSGDFFRRINNVPRWPRFGRSYIYGRERPHKRSYARRGGAVTAGEPQNR